MDSIVDELAPLPEIRTTKAHSRRFNSTSTMTVPDTLAQPNNELTILAVAERLSRLASGAVAPQPMAKYLRQIFLTAQCSVDCTIVCLVYVERLLSGSGLQLTAKNWRSLLTVGMLLASKVHDDMSMVNADFATFLPYKVDQINAWERQFLAGIKYDVRVSASHYTKLYFDLREQANRAPLDENSRQAQRLEQVSLEAQRRMDLMRSKDARRAVSDPLNV